MKPPFCGGASEHCLLMCSGILLLNSLPLRILLSSGGEKEDPYRISSEYLLLLRKTLTVRQLQKLVQNIKVWCRNEYGILEYSKYNTYTFSLFPVRSEKRLNQKYMKWKTGYQQPVYGLFPSALTSRLRKECLTSPSLPVPGPAPSQTPAHYSSPERRRRQWHGRQSPCRSGRSASRRGAARS